MQQSPKAAQILTPHDLGHWMGSNCPPNPRGDGGNPLGTGASATGLHTTAREVGAGWSPSGAVTEGGPGGFRKKEKNREREIKREKKKKENAKMKPLADQCSAEGRWRVRSVLSGL